MTKGFEGHMMDQQSNSTQRGAFVIGYILAFIVAFIGITVVVNQFLTSYPKVTQEIGERAARQAVLAKATSQLKGRSILAEVMGPNDRVLRVRLPNPEDLELVSLTSGVFKLKDQPAFVVMPGIAGSVSANYAARFQSTLGLRVEELPCPQPLFGDAGNAMTMPAYMVVANHDGKISAGDLNACEIADRGTAQGVVHRNPRIAAASVYVNYGNNTQSFNTTDLAELSAIQGAGGQAPALDPTSGFQYIPLVQACNFGLMDFSFTSPLRQVYRPDINPAQGGTLYCESEVDSAFVAGTADLGNAGGSGSSLKLRLGDAASYENPVGVTGTPSFGTVPAQPVTTVYDNTPEFFYEQETDSYFTSRMPAAACQAGQVLRYNGSSFVCTVDQTGDGGIGIGSVTLAPVSGAGNPVSLASGIISEDLFEGETLVGRNISLQMRTLDVGPASGLVLSRNNASRTVTISAALPGGLTEVTGRNAGNPVANNAPDNTPGSIFMMSMSPSKLFFRPLTSGESYLNLDTDVDSVNLGLDLQGLVGSTGLNIPSCGDITRKLIYSAANGFVCATDQTGNAIDVEEDPIYTAALGAAVCNVGEVLTYRGNSVPMTVQGQTRMVPDLDCVSAASGTPQALTIFNVSTSPGTGYVARAFLRDVNNNQLRARSLAVLSPFTDYLRITEPTPQRVRFEAGPLLTTRLQQLNNIMNCYNQGYAIYNGTTGQCQSGGQRVESAQAVPVETCSTPAAGGTCTQPFTLNVQFAQPFTNVPHVIAAPAEIGLGTTGCSRGMTDRIVLEIINITTTGFTIRGGGSVAKQAIDTACGGGSVANKDARYIRMAVNWMAIDGQ